MLRRTTVRNLAAAGALLLGLGTLAACGEDSSEPAGKGLDSVTITGEAGKAPEVKFDGKLEADGITSKVLIEGDGEETAKGDEILTRMWIGNGFSGTEVYSNWEASAEVLPVDDTISKPLLEALEGQKIGSRVAVLASALDSFGEAGNSQLGIGNQDAVLWVVDLVDMAPEPLDGPQGKKLKPASWAPTLVGKEGAFTGFDFKGTKPNGKLRHTVLIQGDGAKVASGQTITVNYLGQVWKAKKPFDGSFGKEPMQTQIGVGQLVKGWDETLVGLTVGSRVIIEIPPAKGYGKEGNEGAGIKGTDTLYFVVDILNAV
ncbi:MAG: FKBP-type peptidyl-prolyl cis-trans isomerase [Nocardioides sp.]|uniref:FKBP-type peptidyl-prolyl cis-trans isomerase n=1 Tax=Nocardioides sp. TaxID=35761 RepID=UPI003F02E097